MARPGGCLRALAAVLVSGVPAWGLAGCAEPICSSEQDAVYQLAPSQRAAAYVDDSTFQSVFGWLQAPDDTQEQSFSCLVERFGSSFSNDVDMLLLVLHLTSAEYVERATTQVISNFTSAQRVFEFGLGSVQRPILAPVGPASMRSYTVLGSREGLVSGPLLHELAHGWAAFLDGPAVLAAQVEQEPLSHWGYSSVGGALGGWRPDSLADLGGGLYQVCSPSPREAFSPAGYANNDVPYAPLELYLMGLIDPEDVPDIDVAVNPQPLPAAEAPAGCGRFRADDIATISIADIVAANGRRRPSAAQAPRHFRLGLIILSEDWLSAEDWGEYAEAMACIEAQGPCGSSALPQSAAGSGWAFMPLNFFEATGGRATLEFVVLEPRVAPRQQLPADEPE